MNTLIRTAAAVALLLGALTANAKPASASPTRRASTPNRC